MRKITGNELTHPATIGDMREPGLTIRQRYAGLAMQALIAPGDINYNMSYMDQITKLAVDFSPY